MVKEQFDLFSGWNKKEENKEKEGAWDVVNMILENRCPNCAKPWYNGHCPFCWYREEDKELFPWALHNHEIQSYFCHTCKRESFSEVCITCWKNLKRWVVISESKKWVGKKNNIGTFLGIKVTYYNFPSRIWEQKANFDFILEPQNQRKYKKKKKLRLYIEYTSDKRVYTGQEWWNEIEAFKIKILRREEYNKNSKNWDKVNFLNDDEYKAIIIVIQNLLKQKNKI